MQAIRKTAPGPGAQIVEIPVPECGPLDLIVEVKAAAMCKSDVEVFEWSPLVAAANYNLPFTLGHEFSGEVTQVGPLVKNFSVGDRVAGETHIPCGICYECRTDRQHICTNNMGVLGRNVDGCFAQYIRLPAISAIKLKKDADFVESSLLEPLGTAMHALQKAQPSGANIAILGTGTIGLMACELAKLLGAARVFAVDIKPSRLEYALKVGADVAINGMEQDFAKEIAKHTNHLDAVVDLTGSGAVINRAVDALSTGGRLVHVGMVQNEMTFERYMSRVVYRELVTTGIFGRHMFRTWEPMMNLLDAGRVNMKAYVGATMPMSDYQKALDMFEDINGRAILIPYSLSPKNEQSE
ncbi:MAG: alcohol dehydrogenase catalytic domain-containing protein [Oscillospiraceae bacterium]|nr:alcohol dehydrogenase catalytic domain-containing protein [Oscillospiraceae bacterium]